MIISVENDGIRIKHGLISISKEVFCSLPRLYGANKSVELKQITPIYISHERPLLKIPGIFSFENPAMTKH